VALEALVAMLIDVAVAFTDSEQSKCVRIATLVMQRVNHGAVELTRLRLLFVVVAAASKVPLSTIDGLFDEDLLRCKGVFRSWSVTGGNQKIRASSSLFMIAAFLRVESSRGEHEARHG